MAVAALEWYLAWMADVLDSKGQKKSKISRKNFQLKMETFTTYCATVVDEEVMDSMEYFRRIRNTFLHSKGIPSKKFLRFIENKGEKMQEFWKSSELAKHVISLQRRWILSMKMSC